MYPVNTWRKPFVTLAPTQRPRGRKSRRQLTVEYLESRLAPAAVVLTDQDDYAPGSTAVITATSDGNPGTNFQVGETVQFHVTRTDGVQDFPPGNEPWRVTDGVGGFTPYQDTAGMWWYPDTDGSADGSIGTTWYVDPQYAGAFLRVTATGQTSGAVATHDFTDASATVSFPVHGATYNSNTWDTLTGTAVPQNQNRRITAVGVSIKRNDTNLYWNGSSFSSSTQVFNLATLNPTTPANGATANWSYTLLASNLTGGVSYTVQAQATEIQGSNTFTALSGSPVFTYAQQSATSLAVASATGTYGGTTTLSATLTSGGSAVSGKSVTFTLNGVSVGSATTDGSGVATLSGVSLAGVNAGTYVGYVGASFTTDSSYFGSNGTNDLTVNKANQTITVTTSAPATAVYNTSFLVAASASSGLPVAIVASGVGSGSGSGSASILMTSGTGTATVTYTQAGDSNYNPATAVVEYVTAQKATATVTLEGLSQTYSGSPRVVTAATSPDGLTVDVTYDGSATAPTNTGSYVVVAAVNDSNYQGSATGTLTVAPADSTVTVTVGNATYDGSGHGGTATVTGAGGLSLALTVYYVGINGTSYASSTTAPTDAGDYRASASYAGDANHTGSSSFADFTIFKAASTTVTLGDGPFTYDGTTHAGGSGIVTGAGGLNTAATSLSYSGDRVNAGVYYVTAHYAGDANHLPSDGDPVAITINPRAATVTADDKTKVYGEANPLLTATVSGTVNGDVLSYTLSTSASTSSGVGDYVITVSLGSNPNYQITPTNGTLTVTPRAITVTADAKTKVYGDADPDLTYQVTSGSLVNGDVFSGALVRDAGENVGSYAIRQGTLTLSSNYDLTFLGATFAITPRDLTVTPVSGQGKVYGTSDPVLTYTHGPLYNGDTASVFSGSLSRAAGEDVGSYAITQGDLSAGGNYIIVFTGGVGFAITPATLTVTADAQSKVYGDADPSLTYQATGFQFSDTASTVLSGALTREVGENVGSYAISQGTLTSNANYTISFTGSSLSITPRPITVTADARTKVFGSTDPVLTYQITSGSLVGSDSFSGALTRDPGETVGSYAIRQGTLALSSNYNLSYVGASLTITVPTSAVVFTDTAGNLVVGGTNNPEAIKFAPVGNTGSVEVFVNDVSRGVFGSAQGLTATGKLIAYGFGGADDIQVAGSITRTAILFGGEGDDRMKGGNGNDILLGEAGDDTLLGGQGRDLIIGGVGADRLIGDAEDDILVAGTTAYDGNIAALCAIMSEWSRTGTGASFAERVSNLMNGVSYGTGSAALNCSTVYHDDAIDVLTGSSGTDWFLFNQSGTGTIDRATDLSAAEQHWVVDTEFVTF